MTAATGALRTPQSWWHPHIANAVTALRLLLTPVFVWLVIDAHGGVAGWLAAVLFAVVVASDLIDGRLARRFGAASATGRLLDHLADIVFILCALGAYARLGVAPCWVPASIATSFAVYALDSWWRGAGGVPTLIGSRIGHAGGVLNYALIGVLVGNETVALHLLSPGFLFFLFALVPMYSGAAIVTRLLRA